MIRPIGIHLVGFLACAMIFPGQALADVFEAPASHPAVKMIHSQEGQEHTDLFDARTSDPAVKMIRFPQSMTVVQSRPSRPLFFPGLEERRVTILLNDRKAIKRTLGKIDPARIVPVTLAEELLDPIKRESLKTLGERYNADIILVFSRRINSFSPGHLRFRNKALLYLPHQNKRLAVPSNETTVGYKGNEFEDKIREMNEQGLKQLAKDVRRVLMSHKFEKRRSNY